jgi:hypothetical protein
MQEGPTKEAMARMCKWLRANGIDAGIVPIEARPMVHNNFISCPIYLKDEHGNFIWVHGKHGERFLEGIAIVPLQHEPSESVMRFLDVMP